MIILLDIDGVMAPISGWKASPLLDDGFTGFSLQAVHALNKIIVAANASVVLTTSHKHRYDLPTWIIDDDKSLNDLPVNIKSKLVLTSSLIGLNEELAERAIQVLMTS